MTSKNVMCDEAKKMEEEEENMAYFGY